MAGWVGFDFDGTLRRLSDGTPIESMVARAQAFLAQGIEIRICTARLNSKVSDEHRANHRQYIEAWCAHHIGQVVPVTAEKDYDMVLLYDDRAVAVETDTGNVKGWSDFVEVHK